MSFPTSPVPNHIEESSRKFLVDEVKTEDGSVFTRLRNTTLQRVWKLTYLQLSASDQTTLNNWYAGKYGSYQSDTWAHPYLVSTVTIRCTEFRWQMGAYPRQTLTVTLEEVI